MILGRGLEKSLLPINQTSNQGVKCMESSICLLCGYIYDPAVGDEDNDIAPGTSFEELPAEWVCPLCGAEKDQFEITDKIH